MNGDQTVLMQRRGCQNKRTMRLVNPCPGYLLSTFRFCKASHLAISLTDPLPQLMRMLKMCVRDNKRCMQLLDQWKSKFPANYRNVNMKIFSKGEGLTREFLDKPTTAILGPGRFERHPDLHPTAYKVIDPNEIRLILPVKGILPMGSAK